jgi:hypothetical protein
LGGAGQTLPTESHYLPSQRKVSGSRLTGYVNFNIYKFKPLAIVHIDCTIVRVIEPHKLLVILRNTISKGTYLT